MAINEHRVVHFIQFVKELYEHPQLVSDTSFKKRIDSSFEFVGRQQEDIFVMSFYAWLKAKLLGVELYDVTLDLVTLN